MREFNEDKRTGFRSLEKPNYIIMTPGFDENIGGIIVLHFLCDILNRLGERAYLWPSDKPRMWVRGSIAKKLRNTAKWFIYARNRLLGRGFKAHPNLISPLAQEGHIRNALAVYPEIYNLNPLDVDVVARWILYKPGELIDRVGYEPRGIFFFFQEFFRDLERIPEGGDLLQVHWIRDDIYRQVNFSERTGSCYLVKKGAGRGDLAPPEGSICIDGKSHEEVAKIFNQVKFFYSYDLYTMYSDYAAMCGCISVVVPVSGLTREQWRQTPAERYGVAYGIEDAEWSQQTRQDLVRRFAGQKAAEENMVRNFVNRCEGFLFSQAI